MARWLACCVALAALAAAPSECWQPKSTWMQPGGCLLSDANVSYIQALSETGALGRSYEKPDLLCDK